MTLRDNEEGLEKFEEDSYTQEVSVIVQGQALVAALNELTTRLKGVSDQEGVVRRGISLLYQARDRRVVLVDGDGKSSEVKGIWR